MADKAVNALDLLMDQHREVEDLFEAIEDAKDNPDERKELSNQIFDMLAIHAKIEETIFYPGVKAEATEDMLLEALEEHLQAKRMIADLMAMGVDDEKFMAGIKVLKEEIEHHVEEEEEELFPEVQKLIDEERLIAMAQEMMAKVVELEGTSPRKNVPAETKEAPPL